MPGQHGGPRPNSGRKPHAQKYESQIVKAADRIAKSLVEITEAMIAVASGRGFEEKWMPAGLVTRKDVIRTPRPPGSQGGPAQPNDDVWLDDKGKPVVIDVQVYPELPPGELVLVERKPWKPDGKVAAELWNRLAGRPAEEAKPDEDRIDTREALLAAKARIAARKAKGPIAHTPPPAPPDKADLDDSD